MKKSIFSLTLLTAVSLAAIAHAETTLTKSVNTDGTTTTTTITRTTDTDPRAAKVTTSKEFTTYAYNRWDKNGDGFIQPDEWDYNVVRWYGPDSTTVYKTYADWDTNHNGKLDETEFDVVMNSTNLYKTWSSTTVTAPAVMTPDAAFAAHDLNGDGKIVPSEWNQTYKP